MILTRVVEMASISHKRSWLVQMEGAFLSGVHPVSRCNRVGYSLVMLEDPCWCAKVTRLSIAGQGTGGHHRLGFTLPT